MNNKKEKKGFLRFIFFSIFVFLLITACDKNLISNQEKIVQERYGLFLLDLRIEKSSRYKKADEQLPLFGECYFLRVISEGFQESRTRTVSVKVSGQISGDFEFFISNTQGMSDEFFPINHLLTNNSTSTFAVQVKDDKNVSEIKKISFFFRPTQQKSISESEGLKEILNSVKDFGFSGYFEDYHEEIINGFFSDWDLFLTKEKKIGGKAKIRIEYFGENDQSEFNNTFKNYSVFSFFEGYVASFPGEKSSYLIFIEKTFRESDVYIGVKKGLEYINKIENLNFFKPFSLLIL